MSREVTATTRLVTERHMLAIWRDAYRRVVNPDDPEGPIDALVPWSAAAMFSEAVQFMTGERPSCEYRRPNLGHIVARGRRAVLEEIKKESGRG